MKPEAITPAKHVAIRQVGLDSLFKEWRSGRTESRNALTSSS